MIGYLNMAYAMINPTAQPGQESITLIIIYLQIAQDSYNTHFIQQTNSQLNTKTTFRIKKLQKFQTGINRNSLSLRISSS